MKKTVSFVLAVLFIFSVLTCNIYGYTLLTNKAVDKALEKFSDELLDAFESAENKKIPIVIWAKDINHDEVESYALNKIGIKSADWETYLSDNNEHDIVQKYISEKRQYSSELYKKHNDEIFDGYLKEEDIIFTSAFSPMLIAEVDYTTAIKVASSDNIVLLDWYNRPNEEVYVAQASDIIRATDVKDYYSFGYGYTGAGIKVGVFEVNLPDVSLFNRTQIITNPYGEVGGQTPHANDVLRVLTDLAPDATYYVASTNSQQSDAAVIEWLMQQGVNIINASRSFDISTALSRIWIDHLAYYHDVHFVLATGNSGEVISLATLSYNAIAVGNLDHKRTDSMEDDVIFEGAEEIFEGDEDILDENGGTIIAGASGYNASPVLAYKPDIVATGTDLIIDENLDVSIAYRTGTSFSTPQVTSAVVYLCQYNSSLLVKQDVVKAILTCSVNFDSPHTYEPDEDEYKKYGAGVLDCVGACWVNLHNRYVQSSISSNASYNEHVFYVDSSDTRIRVSLAFLASSVPASSNHVGGGMSYSNLSNLDLKVYVEGSSDPIDCSISTRNNVEIVDFVPPVSGRYIIRVERVSSVDYTTYYGVAWR